MGFNNKHNGANGRDPDFGAIFMSSSATKRECYQRRLFGLPSSYIQFVEQVKSGMILFLFEYEKRQLHGVFKASCDGAMKIMPNAFSSSGKQFPAQVKFVQIWFCKPLSESLFRDAIRENYFSANKFNFGLSENQVYKLLYLFSKRRPEPQLPGRQLTRVEDLKSEWEPVGKVGRFADHEMHVESIKNKQGVDANILPTRMHKYQGDPLPNDREVENSGYNASDVVVNRKRRAAELATDTTSGYVDDCFSLKNECEFTAYDKEHQADMHLGPMISGGLSRSSSDRIKVHDVARLSMSDRLMSEHQGKTGQRMSFIYNSPGFHHSNVSPSVFYSKPILKCDSMVQNQLWQTSMPHQMQAQISNESCAVIGDGSSKSTLHYDPDFDVCQSSVRINNVPESMLAPASPSNKHGRNFYINQPSLLHPEIKVLDPAVYGSNRACTPFTVARNSVELAAESVVCEAGDGVTFLKPSSAPLPPLDVGNSGGVREPFPFLFHNYKSNVGNDVCPTTLQENLGHEMQLRKNNGMFTPIVPQENEAYSHVQYGDPLIHEHDIKCYSNSPENNSGHRKKGSVFSRLSFMQDVNKEESGKDTGNGEYDFCPSVDEVMEMVRQSHNQWMMKKNHGQWMTKGTIKPLVKHKNAEILRIRTQNISSRFEKNLKNVRMDLTTTNRGIADEKTLKNASMDLTTANSGKTGETAEETCFVNFRRRSKKREINDEIKIRSFNESERSENLVSVQHKRRKLIRPSFSKSSTSDDKSIDRGLSQTLQAPLSNDSCSPKDVSESCCALVQSEDNIKIDAEAQSFVGQTHSEDNNSTLAGGSACREGGKARDGAHIEFNNDSECLENLNHRNPSSSASCEGKSCHNKEGLCMEDCMKLASRDTESLLSNCQEHPVDKVICQEHHVDKVVLACRDIKTEEGISKDHGSSFAIDVKYGSDCFQNCSNENASVATPCD